MRPVSEVEVLGSQQPITYEWNRAKRFWTPLSLIAIDLADLRPAEARRLERVLLGCVRDVDIVCRAGELVLCIILPCTNRTGAEAEVERLRHRLTAGGCEGASFGLAIAFDEADSPEMLLACATRRAGGARSQAGPARLGLMAPPPSQTLEVAVSDVPPLCESMPPTLPFDAPPTWVEPLGSITDRPTLQAHV